MELEVFKVWCPQIMDEKDAEQFRTEDAASAMEQFAESYDRSGDFYFADHYCEVEIHVRDKKDKLTKFDLFVEATPYYRAVRKG